MRIKYFRKGRPPITPIASEKNPRYTQTGIDSERGRLEGQGKLVVAQNTNGEH